MIDVRIINAEHKQDINIPNEPFPLFGRMIPTYVDEHWNYSVEKFSMEQQMCFPDENYGYDDMIENNTFIGAYDKSATTSSTGGLLIALQRAMLLLAP